MGVFEPALAAGGGAMEDDALCDRNCGWGVTGEFMLSVGLLDLVTRASTKRWQKRNSDRVRLMIKEFAWHKKQFTIVMRAIGDDAKDQSVRIARCPQVEAEYGRKKEPW